MGAYARSVALNVANTMGSSTVASLIMPELMSDGSTADTRKVLPVTGWPRRIWSPALNFCVRSFSSMELSPRCQLVTTQPSPREMLMEPREVSRRKTGSAAKFSPTYSAVTDASLTLANGIVVASNVLVR